MPEPLVIRGENGTLRIRHEGESWALLVELELQQLSARTTIEDYFYVGPDLGDYFGRLAERWCGWDGAIAEEGYGLSLSAVHNGLGYAIVTVQLDHISVAEASWSVRGDLKIELGHLERVARDAKRFDAAVAVDEKPPTHDD